MSFRLSALNAVSRRVIKPFIARAGKPEDARRHLEISTRLFLHGPRTATERSALNGVPVVTFEPPVARQDGTIFYLHGGGYIAGSPNTHRAMLSVLAASSGSRVIAPDYRLAPEHPVPAAFEDALAVWATLDPKTTVLGGDSAGGGLALALLSEALQQGARPAGLFAYSPWTDLAATGESLKENAERDVILPVERLPELVDMVLAGADARDTRVSPLYANFHGSPPVHLEVGLSEILRDDTLRMAERLSEQGGDVTVETLPHAPHVWQMLVGILPEARISLERTANFIRFCLRPPVQTKSGN